MCFIVLHIRPLSQSVIKLHFCSTPHFFEQPPPPPQSTSVSEPSMHPFGHVLIGSHTLFKRLTQRLLAQHPFMQSVSNMQTWQLSHGPHSVPPQSKPVSVPFFIPSKHVA